LTGRDGTQFELVDVTFNGNANFQAVLGPAQIDVNPTRVACLSVKQVNEAWLVDLAMVDGTTMQLAIDPDTIVSGEAPFGTVRIAMRDVGSLTSEGPVHPGG
jgi:hypothetical protein